MDLAKLMPDIVKESLGITHPTKDVLLKVIKEALLGEYKVEIYLNPSEIDTFDYVEIETKLERLGFDVTELEYRKLLISWLPKNRS